VRRALLVLLFGWNESLMLETLRCLGSGGQRVTVLAPKRFSALRVSHWCSHYEVMTEPLNLERYGADVIVPGDEDAVRVLSTTRPRHSFPVPDPDALNPNR